MVPYVEIANRLVDPALEYSANKTRWLVKTLERITELEPIPDKEHW